MTVVAQDVDNGYVRYLKDNFNVVDVVCSGDDPWDENNSMVSDYAVLRACARNADTIVRHFRVVRRDVVERQKSRSSVAGVLASLEQTQDKSVSRRRTMRVV